MRAATPRGHPITLQPAPPPQASENTGPTDENLWVVITEALNALPAEQRSVFEYEILKGKTLEEISRLGGVSFNTVSVRVRYALGKICGQLRPYYNDLNRKGFKNMKNNPSKTEDIASQRIITPLAPKRVPSVAPGLEGLAAMAPDACEAAPKIEAFEPDFAEALPVAELVEPAIAYCGVGGNAWEASLPKTVELQLPETDVEESVSERAEEAAEFVVSEEMPEMIPCEVLPEGGIPPEWLRPIVCELPEDFFVTVFEGEIENSVDGVVDGEFVEGEALPFGLEEEFEICVLPVPEEFSPSFDHWFASNSVVANTTGEGGVDYDGEQPDYADDSWSFDPKDLLARYEDFLRDNPDWGAMDPDMTEIQVVTQSSYFGEIEFGTPSKAADFDNWYVNVYSQDAAYGSINLGGAVDGEYGTVVSGNLYSGGKDFLETTGVITDTRNGLTGIPAEWMRGGTVNTGGLFLSGGGPITVAAGGTAVAGGEVVLSGGVASDRADGNTLTLSNGSKVVLEGGQVVSGENVYAYNPEFGSVSLPSSDAQPGAVDLPTEIAITGGAVAEATLPFGNVADGLAPTPNQALIVEFGVLSPSEPLQAPQMQAVLRASADLPQSMVSSPDISTDTSGADVAPFFAVDDSTPNSAPPHIAVSAQEPAPASNNGIKVAAPTAVAGAVAAGTIVHGGAAPRRPAESLDCPSRPEENIVVEKPAPTT